MDYQTLLVLACVFAGSLAGTQRETQCAQECNSQDNEGIFRAFTSYYFSYAVDIDSRINGRNSDQSSSVQIRAIAVIEALSACDMMLKLSNINILERRQDGIMVAAETASGFSETLTAHPLRFSMESNGTITTVCPEAGEEIWALNVKRGFLSHFQIKRTTSNNVLEERGVFETSVTGTCMTVYSPTGPLTFNKSNDYLMCKHRTNLNLFVDAIPLHLQAPPASPLTSRSECGYAMDRQSVSSIECLETHTIKPFAESDSKPETVVHTVITRIYVLPTITSSLRSEFARSTSLLYEDPIQVSEINSDDVRNTITQICNSITNGISLDTPGLFEKLTKQFGEVDTDNVNTVIGRLFRICPQVETYQVMNMVKDALIDCDTEQCAQGFHSIVRAENSTQNEFYLRKWFMKLVFHKDPTKNMISLVKHYVSGSQVVNLPAYYALSSMIHQYCRMSEDDCSRDRDILNAAIIFEDNLHITCLPESEEDTKKILMSLRAIGNMGLIQSNSLLERCNRDQNHNQLRVAAIEAYRRSPCDAVPIDRFMRIFSTVDNDSELRIAAYRAIIRCPSPTLLQDIANTMIIEPKNQVICYVSSHLENLMNSSDIMLADLQNVISRIPVAHFPNCGLDYVSHNYGLSYFDDVSGNGIHFDSDVVFSSKSYLPGSARLAMNVNLFGYGLNLFELYVKIEGWEKALEAVFAPGEENRQANVFQKVKWMMKERVNTALNKINKQYESSRDVEHERSEKVAIGMKVLGNDLFYKDQDDFLRMARMFGREKIMELITSLATQRTHEYSLHKIFKTSKVTIPTVAGMPLEVNIQGALNTLLKASGTLDVMAVMANPRKMAIQGLFEPSAAIEIHCNMMVDAHSARSGLSHKSNLASSFSIGGTLSFKNDVLKVIVTAPPRRETIISASSSLYFMQRDEMVPVSEPEDATFSDEQTLSNPRYNLHIICTRPRVSFSLLDAFFQNWGMDITLYKLEENLVSYDFEAGFRTDKVYRNGDMEITDHFHLLIGAPGSETIGVYSVGMTYHRSNTTLLISTESAATLHNVPNSKRLHLQETVSGIGTKVLEVGMDTILLTNGVKFVPVFAVTARDMSIAFEGHLNFVGEDLIWDFRLVNHIRQGEIIVKGDFAKNGPLRLSLHFPTSSLSLEGGYRKEETPSSILITPIFSLNISMSDISVKNSLSIGGGPLVISGDGVTMNKLYLVETRNTSSEGIYNVLRAKLIEVSDFNLRQKSFGFQCKLKGKPTPYDVEGDLTNNEQYSVNITFPTRDGERSIRGLLYNISSDYIYRLEVIEALNNFNGLQLTTEFKNEVNALQYLEIILETDVLQISRGKFGLQTQTLNGKTRYTPIFISKMFRHDNHYAEGSFDVSESGISVNEMAFVGRRNFVRASGDFITNSTLRLVSFSVNLSHVAFSLQGGYRMEETASSMIITHIFILNSTDPAYNSLSIGGGPLVISHERVTMNEIYFARAEKRLIEVSNLLMRKRSLGFQGKFNETIPFGAEFDMMNDEQYSVNLTLHHSTSGEYSVRGLQVTTKFKNEVNALQYLETTIVFKGVQISRTRTGLQTQALSGKTRYTPIFFLENSNLDRIYVEGSLDLSESGISVNDIALVGAEELVRISGFAVVNGNAWNVSLSYNIGGAHFKTVISRSTSTHENIITLQTSIASDESSDQPETNLSFDFQTSTKGEIFAWDGMVEVDMPRHPDLSFHMETEYILTPGHSTGNIFRLCYNGINCNSTDKRINVSHDVTFRDDISNGVYYRDFEVTYTNAIADHDITLELSNTCTSDVSSDTQLILKDHENDLLTTDIIYVPEGSPTHGSTSVLINAPSYFEYEFIDILHVTDILIN